MDGSLPIFSLSQPTPPSLHPRKKAGTIWDTLPHSGRWLCRFATATAVAPQDKSLAALVLRFRGFRAWDAAAALLGIP